MSDPKPAARTEILVVDDDVPLVRSMAELLRRRGYVVAQAHHGRAAMEFVARYRVDLVISDVFMPEADGLELLGLLRRCVPSPPLVAMSGSSTFRVNGMLKAASMLGAVRTLSKPFDSQELLALVQELIGPPLGGTAAAPVAPPAP